MEIEMLIKHSINYSQKIMKYLENYEILCNAKDGRHNTCLHSILETLIHSEEIHC